jgi:glycosyltransferase involved in cell wall biosynthesis
MLTPVFWPEVRRGTERMVYELASGLSARGHSPLVLTSHRGMPRRDVVDGLAVLRVPRALDGRLQRRFFEDHLTHLPASYAALRLGRYEIAHAWFVTDALVAARWSARTGRPAIHSYMGIPDHRGLMWKRRRLQITLDAVAGCAATVALSHAAAAEFRRWLGEDVVVIHPPVDTHLFNTGPLRTEDPTVVCAAALEDPRKRVDLLVRAFSSVRREHPRARLLLNRPRDPALAAAVVGSHDGIELVDVDDRAALARHYGEAWVSALPSFGEGFGLVLAEALACGTPGVGANSGAIPEVLDRPEIGRLFSGSEQDLTRALLETIELARDPGTPRACRDRALELSSERCIDAYEALYREVLAR